jgi:hypothetical protein
MQALAHVVQSPFQVDRRRTGRVQPLVGACEVGIRPIRPHRQRHAITGCRPDQRRTPHQHRLDRMGGLGLGGQPRGLECEG